MYKNKKDVDKHVEKLLSKLSLKDFNARAYTVARLYFEVGDYGSCQKYLEQYLTYKANNAAAHKLLGQTFKKLGLKDNALEELKISLDLDPAQTNVILDICELLADDEINIDPGRAKYWCEKAELTFPKHPITFKLREKLLAVANPNPEALVKLLTSEIAARPKDAVLHVRLLKHYLTTNKTKEAFDHSCDVEFGKAQFLSSLTWYETLSEVLKLNADKSSDWLYQLLLLTVKERLCTLSISEVPQGSSMSLLESNEFLHDYDQAIASVIKAGPKAGYAEFHSHLLRHHQGQFAFLAATLILKRAKKNKLNWYDATNISSLLLLNAWQIVPVDPIANWLTGASEKQKTAVFRWYTEASYRCSQSGHIILGNNKEKGHLFLDQISQFCCGDNWKERLFENIFVTKDSATGDSYLKSVLFQAPTLRLPQKIEVQAYDSEAQKLYPNSLHHFIWIVSNYKNYSDFKCTIFDMLSPTATSCGPESLNKLDVLAFLYSATLTAQNQKDKRNYISSDIPSLIPANITDILCSLSQIKWWDCAYKFTQNELGSEYTDIRSTLSRGIEVVRCVDNHGLDPELLCILGRIFSNLCKLSTEEDKNMFESRAYLYYASAVPLLEKLKSKLMIKLPSKRLFDYSHKELDNKALNSLLYESKVFIALKNYNDDEYVKAIEYLADLKTPESYFYLGASYHKIASEEKNIININDKNSKYITLLSKSKYYAYKALEGLKEIKSYKSLPLYSNVQDLIENVESCLSNVDSNLSFSSVNDCDTKYSSDDNVSDMDSVHLRRIMQYSRQNLSSTPKVSKKQLQNMNSTNYRTAYDSQVFNNSHVEQQNLKVIEEQIKSLQNRDATIEDFKEQTRNWFDENRKLGNQIINTINSNIEQTTEQFNLLKLSVEQVKDQVSECRKECKDFADLKKQIAELKKEINKLKKSSSEQTIDESDLYNLDDDYRTNENTTFGTQIPFAAPQVMPQFPQRLVQPFPVPPNPYHLYGQNFCNLYNQYSQLAQNTSVPGATTMFDLNRAQPNYPGIYPTSDQMYLDVAHLVPPGIPPPPVVVPTLANVPVVSIGSTTLISSTPLAVSSKTITPTSTSKPISRSLPVNVVITSSDPLPICTSTPAPILSVTIPQKHIKGSPHNYQIQMPSTSEAKSVVPPIFNLSVNKTTTPISTSSDYLSNWSKPSTVFSKNIFSSTTEASKTVVDGPSIIDSPNVSLNKSRTLSERSNTSNENYDPCPDFKPIIPLPAEVKVTTGEENETAIFSARAKLFRFVDKQWKERGIGEMKLLRHDISGKVRVLMRREQVHKICANHIIVPEMEIKPMKNETKAYFWVANDFAEESLILEKFCIRFKTADIAKEFFDTFEKARIESSATNVKTEDLSEVTKKDTEISLTSTNKNNGIPTSKPTIGGFTFNGTPSFKIVPETSKKETVGDETQTSKVSVFSGLTFKISTSSPFSNIISSTPASKIANNNEKEVSNNLNTSDVVEEFEPTAEFKPVVPLPALVDQKTGEENEILLFEHRAKLLRFDGQSKEWKERGLGNIKLLVNKENSGKARLLMRREQIMKVCCNHAITKEITFVKMPNVDKAVTWCAKDFSEGELVSETFCLRFKTVQACNDFIEAVKKVQSKIGDDAKAAKEENNVAKQINETGFGDQFKSKPGSWYCSMCYTNNLESFSECACCEQPKIPHKILNQPTTDAQTKSASSWGDQFKPKPGSWECKQCLIRNLEENVICSACYSAKDPNLKAKDVKKDSMSKFNFGVTPQATLTKEPAVASVAGGWGDKFKPKEGSWECQQCFVRIEKDKEVCPACNSPKISSVTTSAVASVTLSAPKFSFGIPQKPTDQTSAPLSSLFNANASPTFKFGIGQNKEPTSKTFGGLSTDSSKSEAPINFNTKKIEPANGQKPALLPTPNTPNTTNLTFGSKEGGTFNFAFKPKSPTKGKTLAKSPKSVKGDESGDEEYVTDDEGPNIHFSPVIPMPDKVDVVTGEENEDELYGHRAKLYMFADSEWKERGTGIVKILKHKDSEKLRVLMRREQVHKICLNHILSPEVIYKPKDERTWYFAANDYSEGQLHLQQFCIRFQNKTTALQFKDEIDKAIESKYGPQNKDNTKEKEDEVIFVSETQASDVDKLRAKELMLPENFFTYTEKQPCGGCRGCDKDENSEESTPKQPAAETDTPKSEVITPLAPNNITTSVYGTPSSLDRTIDTTTFGTPLSSIFAKEQTFDKSNTATSLSFANRLQQASVLSTKNSNTPSGQQMSTPKSLFESTGKQSIFGFSEAKNIFGSTNKNLFGTSSESKNIFPSSSLSSSHSIFSSKVENKNDEPQKPEVKSIFSSDNYQSPVNLFSQSTRGSLFGPKDNKTEANSSSGIFGQAVSFSFGNVNEKPAVTEDKENVTQSTTVESKPLEINADTEKDKGNNSEKGPFNLDKCLTFAALSTKNAEIAIQKKSNDFKWEGAGQQLFSTSKVEKDQSNEDTSAGDEEYDPHYEPIVPLPDKIVVTTGEEDEEKIFGERCKLYRFDEKSKEWKERGVGEMKILYHPERKSYRMLLRREQVHKAVLNMLIFMDLELLPMKNSDCAWTWAGRNYADIAGEQETLAVRFKSIDLASNFKDKVLHCVRKLQVAAAEEIRKEKEEKALEGVAPLRLPMGMDDSARADKALAFVQEETSQNERERRNGDVNESGDSLKQVHFQEQEHEEEDYEHDYGEDYDGYYNEEEEEESAMYYACDGEVIIEQDGLRNTAEEAHVQVLFDQDVCSPKILVTDNFTGEILADMLIHTDTVFHISGDSCSWSGVDYTSNTPANKTVTVNFPDSETTMDFYDSCETSKASTYDSHDPES